MSNLKALYDRGVANGVPGLRILSKEEVHEMEPNLEDDICAALYAPSAGIVCPFNLNIALAENANVNGVEFKFDTEVTDLKKSGRYLGSPHKSGCVRDKICGQCSRCLCGQISQYGQ